MLLDLIYRLSLDGKESKGDRRERTSSKDSGRREAKDKHNGDGALEKKAPADSDDDEDKRLRQRAKEARRADLELERKEKVLRSALREDRREERSNGRAMGKDLSDDSDGHPHLFDTPKQIGDKIPITATNASGEQKMIQIERSSTLDTLFKAAKSKLKFGKTPNVAKIWNPPGIELVDTLTVHPGAVVFVSFEKDRKKEKKETKVGTPKDEGIQEESSNKEGIDASTSSPATAPDDSNSTRLRLAMAKRVSKHKIKSSQNKLQPGPAMDAENNRLLELLLSRRKQNQPKPLPAHSVRQTIIDAIDHNKSPVILLTGETGSGKTTQVPKFVFENFCENKKGSEVNILVAQPRRVAATSVARRVAHELGESVGETIGYTVKGDTSVSDRTRITFMTTGVLLRKLIVDPNLENITHVFVDEIHERSAEADFLLSYLRDLVVKQYSSTKNSGDATHAVSNKTKLKVILMSATMSSDKFEDYLKSAFPKDVNFEIPKPHIKGRTFGVTEKFMEDYQGTDRGVTGKNHNSRNDSRNNSRSDFDSYAKNLITALPKVFSEFQKNNNKTDAALVFLPGAVEINKIGDLLKSSLSTHFYNCLHFVPLHGQLSSREQQLAFDPAPVGKIKIVLATNVAETSLTIPDITVVFDSGRVKKNVFDPKSHMSSLKEGWCSLASSTQRAGRAGRVCPGVCIRLFTKEESTKNQPAYDLPELQTTPLESLVMHAMLMNHKEDPEFVLGNTVDPPPLASIRQTVKRLRSVGAVETVGDDEREEGQASNSKVCLTPLGFHLAHLPVDPRLGKMLVYATVLGCLNPVLTIAASIMCKPAFGVDPENRDQAVANKRKVTSGSCEKNQSRDTNSSNFGAKSDHLAAAKAFDSYQLDRNKACNELNLNRAAMSDIQRERTNLLKKLHENGFDPKSDAANKNQSNDDVVRCVLLSGLFPNVAEVSREGIRGGKSRNGKGNCKGAGTRGRAVVKDVVTGSEVAVHPSSVNGYQIDKKGNSVGGPGTGYLVYQEAVETSQVFLRDTTAVPVEALLLFGGDISVDHAGSTVSVNVGVSASENGNTSSNKIKKLTFPSSPEVGVLFKLLRNELNRVLAVAAEDPAGKESSLEATEEGRRLRDVLLRLFPGGSIRE